MNNLTIQRYLKFLNPVRVCQNIKWRYSAQKSDLNHVFIVGIPRSGTSLIFSIIRAHPAFSSIDNETYFFVPRDIFNQNYKNFYDNQFIDYQTLVTLRNQSYDLVDFYDKLTQFILTKENKQRFIEKTPKHLFYLKYLVEHYPNAKFINMIRDGRDCYLSHKKLESYLHKNVDDFAHFWQNGIALREKLNDNSQIIDIKYEQLTKHPWQIMSRVMEFIGEQFYPQQIETHAYSKTSLSNIQGHDRLKRPIEFVSANTWQQKMNIQEINIFNKIAGQTLEKLGYSVS